MYPNLADDKIVDATASQTPKRPILQWRRSAPIAREDDLLELLARSDPGYSRRFIDIADGKSRADLKIIGNVEFAPRAAGVEPSHEVGPESQRRCLDGLK